MKPAVEGFQRGSTETSRGLGMVWVLKPWMTSVSPPVAPRRTVGVAGPLLVGNCDCGFWTVLRW